MEMSKSISIIGTGDFGKAIGKRLISSGYDVTYGSRRPEYRNLAEVDHSLAFAKVMGIGDAVCANDVIVFAGRVVHFQEIATAFEKELSGKIVIDVSNTAKSTKVLTSNAEFLQTLLPEATIVKAFNVISAYALDTDYSGSSRVVPVASDDYRARGRVQSIVRDLGFQPFDAGMLVKARNMETTLMQLFPKWRFPCLSGLAVFVAWFVYLVYLCYIKEVVYTWEQLFGKVFNRALCMTAITLLGLTYLPGCLAGFLQLKNGTKYKRFPSWLDFWLKSRKQLGLTSFALAAMHALFSSMLLSASYNHTWFHYYDVVIPVNMTSDVHITLPGTSWMNWKGEIMCLTGLLTFTLLCILAVTSLPSVADSLNWAEWRFVQSRLGYLALFLAVAHAYVLGMPLWVQHSSFVYMWHSITFTSSLMPSIVLLLRLILALPLVSHRLAKIRAGWERNSAMTCADEERNFGEPDTSAGKRESANLLMKMSKLEGDVLLTVGETDSPDNKCYEVNDQTPSSDRLPYEEGQGLRKENMQGRECCAHTSKTNENQPEVLRIV